MTAGKCTIGRSVGRRAIMVGAVAAVAAPPCWGQSTAVESASEFDWQALASRVSRHVFNREAVGLKAASALGWAAGQETHAVPELAWIIRAAEGDGYPLGSLTALVAAAVADDFRTGAVIEVDGWLLSRQEATVLAAAGISRR